MSYERYKEYRLAPDDNGCWDVLTGDTYEQRGTYPSKAAAKRAIDDLTNNPPAPDRPSLRQRIEQLLDSVCMAQRDVPAAHLGDYEVNISGYTDAILSTVADYLTRAVPEKIKASYIPEMGIYVDPAGTSDARWNDAIDEINANINRVIGGGK